MVLDHAPRTTSSSVVDPRIVEGPTPGSWSGASQAEVVIAQVLAVRDWVAAAKEAAPVQGQLSRVDKAERDRRAGLITHVSHAIQAQAAAALRSGELACDGPATRRAVVAHRHDWFAEKLVDGLATFGFVRTIRVGNGAEALAATIVEQPDLLVVEDAMALLPAQLLLPEVRRFASRTVVAVQVEGSARADALRHAGAVAPFSRTLPPAEVACGLAALIEASLLSAAEGKRAHASAR